MIKLIKPITIWLLWFPVYWVVLLSTIILSPLLPLFAIGKDNLPDYLSWFTTPNANLDGDSGFQKRYLWATNKYLRRVIWLTRNPAGGWCWSPAGKYIDKGVKIHFKGTQNVSERVPGWQFIWADDYSCCQFRLYTKPRLGKLLKLRLGWKMRSLANDGVSPGELVKYCWTFNPVRSEKK